MDNFSHRDIFVLKNRFFLSSAGVAGLTEITWSRLVLEVTGAPAHTWWDFIGGVGGGTGLLGSPSVPLLRSQPGREEAGVGF